MFRTRACVLAVALAAAGAGIAQRAGSAKSGLVYYVKGQVSIAGAGRLPLGISFRQLQPDDILFTERGQVEILLNPGAVLRLGDNSRIRMDRVQLTDARVSLEAGSAVVSVDQPPKADRVEIHMGGRTVVWKGSGVYRLDADPGQLRVYRGAAEVSAPKGPTILAKRGQSLLLADGQLSSFDTRDADGLQLWAAARETAARTWQNTLKARTPFDLVRLVNQHVRFEWTAMGTATGAAAELLETCGWPSFDCSAKLVDLPDPARKIVILRSGIPAPAFLLYRQTPDGAAWEFAGAYGAGSDLEPDYRIARRGLKTYLAVARRGTTESGADVATEDWIDLAAPNFEPAFSLVTRLKFSHPRAFETTASIVAWDSDPVETVQVEYRASAGPDDGVPGPRTAAATFVRQGDKFVFDPSRSTVPAEARWGAFDIDGRLLSHSANATARQ